MPAPGKRVEVNLSAVNEEIRHGRRGESGGSSSQKGGQMSKWTMAFEAGSWDRIEAPGSRGANQTFAEEVTVHYCADAISGARITAAWDHQVTKMPYTKFHLTHDLTFAEIHEASCTFCARLRP